MRTLITLLSTISVSLLIVVSLTSCKKNDVIEDNNTEDQTFSFGEITYALNGETKTFSNALSLVSRMILDTDDLVVNLQLDNSSSFLLGITGNFRSSTTTPTEYILANGTNDTFVFLLYPHDLQKVLAYYTATLTITNYNPTTGKLKGFISGQGNLVTPGSNEHVNLLNGVGVSILNVNFEININEIIDNVDGSLSKTFI